MSYSLELMPYGLKVSSYLFHKCTLFFFCIIRSGKFPPKMFNNRLVANKWRGRSGRDRVVA